MIAEASPTLKSHKILALSTFGFLMCFSAWMINGVLVTYLTDNGIFRWDMMQIGWLMGVPVLTGAVCRLPMGIWYASCGLCYPDVFAIEGKCLFRLFSS